MCKSGDTIVTDDGEYYRLISKHFGALITDGWVATRLTKKLAVDKRYATADCIIPASRILRTI